MRPHRPHRPPRPPGTLTEWLHEPADQERLVTRHLAESLLRWPAAPPRQLVEQMRQTETARPPCTDCGTRLSAELAAFVVYAGETPRCVPCALRLAAVPLLHCVCCGRAAELVGGLCIACYARAALSGWLERSQTLADEHARRQPNCGPDRPAAAAAPSPPERGIDAKELS